MEKFKSTYVVIITTILLSFCSLKLMAQVAAKSIASTKSCSTNDLLNKSYLSCISCALEKKNLPTPDPRYLAALGLATRENYVLLPEVEQNGQRKSLNSPYVSIAKLPDGKIFKNKQGQEVSFTLVNQYHRHVMESLLAGGYCPKEKMKAEDKSEDYSDFVSRIEDETFVQNGFAKDIKKKFTRNSAARELGATDWDELNNLFFLSKEKTGKSFLQLSFQEQQYEFKKRRKEYLAESSSVQNSDYNSFHKASNKKKFYTDCFENLDEENNNPLVELKENPREVCEAIYNECGITRTRFDCEFKYPASKPKAEIPVNNRQTSDNGVSQTYIVNPASFPTPVDPSSLPQSETFIKKWNGERDCYYNSAGYELSCFYSDPTTGLSILKPSDLNQTDPPAPKIFTPPLPIQDSNK